MHKFIVGFLKFLAQVLATVAAIAVAVVVVLAVVSRLALWWAKWGVIEPLLGLVGVLAGAPAAYFWALPRRSAWLMYAETDGSDQWLQTHPTWSPRAADELAAKAAYSAAFGKFAGAADAQFPVEPTPVHTKIVWVGTARGVYRAYAFRVGTHVPAQFGVELGATAPTPSHEKSEKAPALGW